MAQGGHARGEGEKASDRRKDNYVQMTWEGVDAAQESQESMERMLPWRVGLKNNLNWAARIGPTLEWMINQIVSLYLPKSERMSSWWSSKPSVSVVSSSNQEAG